VSVVRGIPARNRVIDVDACFVTLGRITKHLEDVVADVTDRLVAVTSIYRFQQNAMITIARPMYIAVTPPIEFVRIKPVMTRAACIRAQARQDGFVLSDYGSDRTDNNNPIKVNICRR
jgi:hypothetical protein